MDSVGFVEAVELAGDVGASDASVGISVAAVVEGLLFLFAEISSVGGWDDGAVSLVGDMDSATMVSMVMSEADSSVMAFVATPEADSFVMVSVDTPEADSSVMVSVIMPEVDFSADGSGIVAGTVFAVISSGAISSVMLSMVMAEPGSSVSLEKFSDKLAVVAAGDGFGVLRLFSTAAISSDSIGRLSSRKLSGRTGWSSHSVPKKPPGSVSSTIPPNFPKGMPDSAIFEASVSITHSTVSASLRQFPRRMPFINPSLRRKP